MADPAVETTCARRLDALEARVLVLEHTHEEIDTHFIRHMEAEERMFADFRDELKAMRSDLHALNDHVHSAMVSGAKSMSDFERRAGDTYITKSDIRMAWVVAGAVVAGMLFLFATFAEKNAISSGHLVDSIAHAVAERLAQ